MLQAHIPLLLVNHLTQLNQTVHCLTQILIIPLISLKLITIDLVKRNQKMTNFLEIVPPIRIN